jgi:BMFP domain-containing protein YqiC
MQSQNRLLDDLARVASGAFGVAAGMRSEAESRMREQFERVLSRMDLVTREDHEAAYTMAQNARDEQAAMAERLSQLEAKVAELEGKLAAQESEAPPGGGSQSGAGGKSTKSTKSSGSKSGGKSASSNTTSGGGSA